MRDIIGQEIKINDMVATSYLNSPVTMYRVIGYTPQKVRLLRPKETNENYYILKYPNEMVVVPGAVEYMFKN